MRFRLLTFLSLLGLLLIFLTVLPVQAQRYPLGPDSQEQPGVPKGEVTPFKFTSTRLYPGTERDCWIYVPKQYDGTKPACVMVFNDGGGFQDRNGQWRVPVVFDNLIAKGEMPVTIAVFVNPGVAPPVREGALPRFNRSVEYDTPDDNFARFLTEEILPEVGKKYKLTDDPNGRAICGASSGGIAAFTAAWFRPDLFRRVYSAIGSFTDLRGGNTYPSQIRKTEAKPIRVFMQDGSNDQDIYSGSWFIGNNDIAAALRFAGYSVEYVIGEQGHSGEHGGALLPDALRFLWKGYPEPIKATPSGRQPVSNVLIAGEAWQEATGEAVLPNTERPAKGMTATVRANDGTTFGIDSKGKLWRTTRDGKKQQVGQGDAGVRALCLSPDQTLLFVPPAYEIGKYVWSWRVTPEGLRDGQRYHDLYTVYGKPGVGASAMLTDTNGWLYVATEAGIQMLDQAGRVNGIILSPTAQTIDGMTWGGPNKEYMYVLSGGKIYRRKTQAKGVLSTEPPVTPPGPRL